MTVLAVLFLHFLQQSSLFAQYNMLVYYNIKIKYINKSLFSLTIFNEEIVFVRVNVKIKQNV